MKCTASCSDEKNPNKPRKRKEYSLSRISTHNPFFYSHQVRLDSIRSSILEEGNGCVYSWKKMRGVGTVQQKHNHLPKNPKICPRGTPNHKFLTATFGLPPKRAEYTLRRPWILIISSEADPDSMRILSWVTSISSLALSCSVSSLLPERTRQVTKRNVGIAKVHKQFEFGLVQ